MPPAIHGPSSRSDRPDSLLPSQPSWSAFTAAYPGEFWSRQDTRPSVATGHADHSRGLAALFSAVSPAVASILSDVAGKSALATPTGTAWDAIAQSPPLASGSFATGFKNSIDNLGIDRERRTRVRLALAGDDEIGVALGAAGALREIKCGLDRPEGADDKPELGKIFRQDIAKNTCSKRSPRQRNDPRA